MPTISYSIGGEKHDISGKSGKEVVKMVKAEYAKQKKIKFKVKKVEEEEPYLCVDCGKDFKWKSGTSSTGAGVNSYHCGSCGVKEWDSFNKKQAEEEEDVECNSCEETICDSNGYNECEECSKIICDSCRHSCYSICYDCKPKGMLEEEVECECCEEEEEVDHNYCEKCGRPSEVWGGNPHKGMCKKCSISEGWAKWCDKHDKISYKTEKGEGCRDCKKEDFYNPYKNTADYA